MLDVYDSKPPLLLNVIDYGLDNNKYSSALYCVSFIINITYGGSADNWEKIFEIIKQNKWFDVTKKTHITDDVDITVLEKYCGTEEGIIRVDDMSNLKSFIDAISVLLK